MDRAIVLHLSEETIGLVRALLPKAVASEWVSWAPWAAVIAAIVALIVNSWVQFGLSARSFRNQRHLEEAKERRAAHRKYIEDAYRGLLELMNSVEDLANNENQNRPLTEERWSRNWRCVRQLRMQVDFTNNKSLAEQFSKVDAARREVEMAVVSRHNQESGPKLPIDPQDFAAKCDELQAMLRDALVQGPEVQG